MINWGDVLQQQEQDTVRATFRVMPTELGLRGAIRSVGSPQNPFVSNRIESTYDEAGDPYLRPNGATIGDGVLGP